MEQAFVEKEDILELPVRDNVRAIQTLIEELEAINSYYQKYNATSKTTEVSKNLAKILKHNMDDEMEHVGMLLEHLRLQFPELDVQLRKFLFGGELSDKEIEE